jgi:hypothetical protein
MMKQKSGVIESWQRYSEEFKEQALRWAERRSDRGEGLKLPAGQLCAQRFKAFQRGRTSEE